MSDSVGTDSVGTDSVGTDSSGTDSSVSVSGSRDRRAMPRAPAPGVSTPGVRHTVPAPRAGYLNGTTESMPLAMSAPALRDLTEDIARAWAPVAARTMDAFQNNGWIAGGVEAAISTIIGTGLKLNAKPDHEALGWTASEASAWARAVERRYEARCANKWAVDASGRYTAGQMEAAHLRQFLATGEGISQFLRIPRPGVANHTRVRLLPAHRLGAGRRTASSTALPSAGVFLDGHGAPRAYRFRIDDARGYPVDVDLPARDRFGRPVINHVFDGHPAQIRGISLFAPVLRTLHDYDRLSKSTLAASLLHAMYAATFESEYPTDQVLAAMGGDEEKAFKTFLAEALDWNSTVDLKLGDKGRIPHLLPGESLNIQTPAHPNANYEPFANFLLREVARCLGCLFEDLTGDYRGATYSSLQNGIAKIWPITLYRRRHIAVPFCQAGYDAWLEEEIDGGRVAFPGGIDGFVMNRDAATRADWRGPPKPVADELKAARADEIYYGLGVKSQGRIAADRGDDIETVHEDLEREMESRRDRGLPEPCARGMPARVDAGDETEEDEQRTAEAALQ